MNTVDYIGRTALHYACIYGTTRIVKALLDSGGDMTIRDQYGKSGATPPDYAKQRGDQDMVALLIQKKRKREDYHHALPRKMISLVK